MNSEFLDRRRTWSAKFRDAGRGLVVGIRGQSSFAVHLLAATAVIGCAAWLRVGYWKWSVLLVCIAAVLTAELLNASLEKLARAVTSEHDPHVRDALDIAAGAVLIVAVFAAIVGLVVLGPDLWAVVAG